MNPWYLKQHLKLEEMIRVRAVAEKNIKNAAVSEKMIDISINVC